MALNTSDATTQDEQALVAEVNALSSARKLSNARQVAESAIVRFPHSADLASALGFICKQLGDFPAAVTACDNAIALGCQAWITPFMLGLSHRALGDHPKASMALMQALERRPGHVENLTLLLEEVVVAFGIDSGREVYQTVIDPALRAAVQASWIDILFRHGDEADLTTFGIESRVAHLMSVTEWTAKHGHDIHYVDEIERIRVENPEPLEARSEAPFKTLANGYRPYACLLEDVTILSRSDLVLTHDGAALNDTLTDSRFGQFVQLIQEKAVKGRDGQRLLIDMAPFNTLELEAGVMLSGAASVEFGHWMPEYLCRLRALSRHETFASLPIIVDAGMPTSHYDYLRRVVSNELVVLPPDTALHCKRLLIAPTPSFYPMHLTPDHQVPGFEQGPFSPACFGFLRDRVQANLPPLKAPGRRLYLSRRNRKWRLMTNDSEIAAFLEARGFETIYPEDLTFEQQVRLFQEAEAIVGPNGSSWINLIFAAPSVKVLVMAQANFASEDLFGFSGFVGPMRTLGYDPVLVVGERGDMQQKHIDFSVSLERLEQAMAFAGM